VLEVFRLRQRSILGKEGPNVFDKVAAERIPQGDHDEKLQHRKLSRVRQFAAANPSCGGSDGLVPWRARDLFSKLRICNLRFVDEAIVALRGNRTLDRRSKFQINKLLMRLLDRYVLRNFLQAYSYCIAGFISIWFIFDISDNISTFLDERVSRSLIAKYYLMQAPQILVILLPVALL